jgi:hypothetical protein
VSVSSSLPLAASHTLAVSSSLPVIIRRALVVALTPGSYTVAFQPQSGPTLDALIDNVAPAAMSALLTPESSAR